MTGSRTALRLAAGVATTMIALAAGPALAATAPNGPAASAEAYGLLVDVQLLPTHTPLKHGPRSWAAQEFPPGAAQPAEAQDLEFGPLPADGSLVNHIGVQTSIAGANGTPQGVASAEVADVSLLKQNGNPIISADLIRAQANTDCVNTPNATGTTFVNLKINGTPIENTPQPNTVIDLQVAKVILNEQRPAYDGRGIVVNAIHVISTTTGDALFRGDIIVSHAMSTVNCTNGAGTTGDSNVVKMVKTASPNVVKPGQELTYTAKVTNSSGSPCLVNRFIEHLSSAFDFVSTSGDFGNALDSQANRPGGGVDLLLGNGKTIAAGGTFTQTFVVRAKDTATAGVYFNNLEILCANLGDFVKGLDAPVRITEEVDEQESPAPSPQPTRTTPTQPRGPLPHTGPGAPVTPLLAIATLGLATLAATARRLLGNG